MKKERMMEIERKVFYKHTEMIKTIMKYNSAGEELSLEIGIEMGYLHRDLMDELEKEVEAESEERYADSN